MARTGYPSLPGTIGLLFVTLAAAAALAVLTLALFPGWPEIVKMALPTEVALAGAVGYAVARSGRPWREALALRPLDSAMLGPLFLVLIGSITVFSELYLIIQRVAPVPEAFERMLRDLMQITGTADLVATVVIAVLVAPVLEEALFRGVLLQGLARRRGPAAATIWTAVFFSLYHFYNPWQVIPTFFLGLVLAWVVLATRTLISGILVHAAFNTISLGLFAAPVRERDVPSGSVVWVVAAIFGLLLLGSAAFGVGMAWLERQTGGGWFGAGRAPAEDPDHRAAVDPHLLPAADDERA